MGIRYAVQGVGKYQLEDSFVCLSAKATQSAWTQDFSRDQKRFLEEQRRRQNKQHGSQQKRAGARPVDSGWVGQHEKMSQYSWRLYGNFARIHARNRLQMHRQLHKRVTNFSLLALRANPSPCLLVLFSSTLLVVYVVFCFSVNKCEILLTGDGRNR